MKRAQTKKLGNNKVFSLIFLSLAMAFVIANTFSTDFFPKNSKELIEQKKKYKTIISNRDLAFQKAINNSDIEKIREIIETSKIQLQKYTKEKNRIIANDRFFGYTSFKYFLLGTSSSLLSFTISLLFLFIVVKYVRGKYIKRYYLITSYVFVITTGYWLAWSLLYFSLDPKRGFDFPKSWYYVCIYFLPTLIFIGSYYLIKYHHTIESKLKNGIKLLIDYISIDLFDKRIREKEKKEVLIENLEKYDELTKMLK